MELCRPSDRATLSQTAGESRTQSAAFSPVGQPPERALTQGLLLSPTGQKMPMRGPILTENISNSNEMDTT